jgi:glycosyltransferase 2 family protein
VTRPVAALAFLIGLAATVALVLWFGVGAIAAAVAGLGWPGFLVFCFAHAPAAVLLGAGWRVCLAPGSRVSLAAVVWARLLRDAGGEVLPFSQIGGYVIGARAAVMAGVSGVEAAATTLADLTTEAVAQIVFTALGLGALAHLRPGAALIYPTLAALVAIVALSVALAATLRRGRGLSRFGGLAARRWLAGFGDVDRTLAALRAIGERRAALAASLLLHLAAWLGVALEAWLALRLMGAPISVEAAVALESLLFAARSLAFLAPGAIGVQEGAYALLAPLVGLSPTDALALSLIKRARDLAIGAPALLIWQRSEIARAWRRRREREL